MKQLLDAGRIGAALVLHCVHRNPSAPPDVSSGTIITNSAIHEIDLARWLLADEISAATVHRQRRGRTPDPLVLILEAASGALVDVEVFVNARYGYDVRCELVGEEGAVSLDAPPA